MHVEDIVEIIKKHLHINHENIKWGIIGVTELIKCPLRLWFEDKEQPIMTRQMYYGDLCHKALFTRLHPFTLSHIMYIEPELVYPVWCNGKNIHVIGRPDIVAIGNGKLKVIEVKFANVIVPEYFKQVAVYKLLARNKYWFKKEDTEGYIMQITDDGEIRIHKVEEEVDEEWIWYRACQLYEYFEKNEQPPPEKGDHCKYCPYRGRCTSKTLDEWEK